MGFCLDDAVSGGLVRSTEMYFIRFYDKVINLDITDMGSPH